MYYKKIKYIKNIKTKRVLTKLLIPVLSLRQWEIWVSSKVGTRIGPILHNDQLAMEPYEELGIPGHLLASSSSGHQSCPSSHPGLPWHWICHYTSLNPKNRQSLQEEGNHNGSIPELFVSSMLTLCKLSLDVKGHRCGPVEQTRFETLGCQQ